MMPSVILYEYPFNERIRTYLRLEQLFQRLDQLITSELVLHHHYALTTIFEMMDVATRADLKSDVLKDLEKQKNLLNGFRGNPVIAESVLDHITNQLTHSFTALSELPGRVGQSLADNEWLMGIRSRVSIPGGTCSFDLPAYHAWQHKSDLLRQQDLIHWATVFQPLAEAIFLLLQMLRDSGIPQKVMAEHGHFQQALSQRRPCQLVRLHLEPALDVVPEISGNRLIVMVRLLQPGAKGRLLPCSATAGLDLTLCA